MGRPIWLVAGVLGPSGTIKYDPGKLVLIEFEGSAIVW